MTISSASRMTRMCGIPSSSCGSGRSFTSSALAKRIISSSVEYLERFSSASEDRLDLGRTLEKGKECGVSGLFSGVPSLLSCEKARGVLCSNQFRGIGIHVE